METQTIWEELMIALEPLERFIKLILASGYLEGQRPLSLALVSDTASGKSDLLGEFREAPGVLYHTYKSFSQLIQQHGRQIATGNIHHIIIPDLGIIISKPPDTAGAELSALNSLIEEGIIEWSTRATSIRLATPTTIGLLTAIAPASLPRLERVTPAGFWSRFIRADFHYQPETAYRIRHAIQQGTNNLFDLGQLKTLRRARIELNPEVTDNLQSSGFVDRVKAPDDTYGFRVMKQLLGLAAANALLAGRSRIEMEDIIALAEFQSLISKGGMKI